MKNPKTASLRAQLLQAVNTWAMTRRYGAKQSQWPEMRMPIYQPRHLQQAACVAYRNPEVGIPKHRIRQALGKYDPVID